MQPPPTPAQQAVGRDALGFADRHINASYAVATRLNPRLPASSPCTISTSTLAIALVPRSWPTSMSVWVCWASSRIGTQVRRPAWRSNSMS